VGGYAGIYYGGGVPPGSHGGGSTGNASALSALQSWQSAAGYPPSLLSQLAAGSGLFVSNGNFHGIPPGSLPGLPSGFSGLNPGLNGSLAQSPTSREDTPHSMSPKHSPEMVKTKYFCCCFVVEVVYVVVVLLLRFLLLLFSFTMDVVAVIDNLILICSCHKPISTNYPAKKCIARVRSGQNLSYDYFYLG
jgi:hypothetical protein